MKCRSKSGMWVLCEWIKPKKPKLTEIGSPVAGLHQLLTRLLKMQAKFMTTSFVNKTGTLSMFHLPCNLFHGCSLYLDVLGCRSGVAVSQHQSYYSRI